MVSWLLPVGFSGFFPTLIRPEAGRDVTPSLSNGIRLKRDWMLAQK
jgi:hypothetical protein